MTVTVVKEKLYQIVVAWSGKQGLVFAIGIAALCTGILVDHFVIRLFSLVLVILAVGVLYFSFFHREGSDFFGNESSTESSTPKSKFLSSDYDGNMKKFNFDDSPEGEGDAPESRFQRDPLDSNSSDPAENSPIPFRDSARTDEVSSPLHTLDLQSKITPEGREYSISDFFDVTSDIYRSEAEPRAEFDFLLGKVLTVMKDVLFAHTVAFFWANRDKGQMVLEARVSDSSAFMTKRRFQIGHDLVSKVAQSGKPELVMDVNPQSERELLPYYDTPAQVRSFIGVPVYFIRNSEPGASSLPVAVIVVDNKAADEFGQETLVLLGQFTKLVSAMIKSYTDKYDLLLDSELLRSIRRLQQKVRESLSFESIIQALSDETAKLINWDYLSIVLFDDVKKAWTAKKVINRTHRAYIAPEQAVAFPESIVGQTIRNNTHTLVDDLDVLAPARYYAGEKIETKGSFVSIPLSSFNKCYGAITIESGEKFNFSRRDIDILYRLAEHAAAAIEVLYLNEMISEYVIVDDATGMFSRKFFLQRVSEELHRSDEMGNDLSMLFLTIDRANEITERFDIDGFERVIMTVAKAVRASVRPYDIVGRYDRNRFGVLLVDTASSDAYLWAEKIRKNLASYVINLDGKTFSVTISIGVCGMLEGMRREELLGNTVAVLSRAVDAGGNTVRVY